MRKNGMPTKYLDEEGLSHVVRRAKETFADKKELWNWQKTEKAGAVAFEPVPDSVLEPVVEFKFKETLPAEGEKGPDNPSTIEGVSSATIWHTGKNLRIGSRTEGTYTRNGLTYTYNSDGSITFNGTATEGTFVYLNGGETKIPTKANFTYILSGCPSGGSQDTYSLSCTSPFNGSTVYAIDRGNGFIINKSQDMSWDMYIYINSGITISNLTFKPQIEIGSIATDYEPPILLSEAIHVFSLGNTYYGGSLDVNSGLLTIAWEAKTLIGTENWSIQSEVGDTDTFTTFQSQLNLEQNVMTADPSSTTRFCSHFSYDLSNQNYESYYTWAGATNVLFRRFKSEFPDVDIFKSWLASEYNAGHPVVIGYKLRSPYTVQLDSTQIKSLASLDKYSPKLNTIYTDQESVQVGYQRYVDEGRNAVSASKLQSSVSLTTNLASTTAIAFDGSTDQNSIPVSGVLSISNGGTGSNTQNFVDLSNNQVINGVKTFGSTIEGVVERSIKDGSGNVIANTYATKAVATSLADGLMSSTDKSKLDSIGTVFDFKGSVANTSSLPGSDNTAGDAYLVQSPLGLQAWNGTSWVDIGSSALLPISDSEIDAVFA